MSERGPWWFSEKFWVSGPRSQATIGCTTAEFNRVWPRVLCVARGALFMVADALACLSCLRGMWIDTGPLTA